MTPAQSARADLLKLRAARRVQREPMIARYLDVGLTAEALDDDRTERLAALLVAASPTAALEDIAEWMPSVRDYADGLSELTVMDMWDCEASVPICRVSAASIAERPEVLAQLFPSGFCLIGKGDRDALAVDLDFDEDAQEFVARSAILKLYPRGLGMLSERLAG